MKPHQAKKIFTNTYDCVDFSLSLHRLRTDHGSIRHFVDLDLRKVRETARNRQVPWRTLHIMEGDNIFVTYNPPEAQQVGFDPELETVDGLDKIHLLKPESRHNELQEFTTQMRNLAVICFEAVGAELPART